MKQNNIKRLVPFVLCFLLGVSCPYFFHRYQSYTENLRVFGTCHSDRIYLFLNPLKTYAAEHGGILPDPQTLHEVMTSNGYSIPKCADCDEEFVINKDLDKINLSDDQSRLLIWCPSNAHKYWFAAMFMSDGELVVKTISKDELVNAIEAEVSLEER